MAVRRLLPLVLALGLLVTACSFTELVAVVEGSGSSADLDDPENPPDVRAAGASAQAMDEEREARELLDEGLREHDVGKVTAVRELRPHDPRLPVHQAVFGIADGGMTYDPLRRDCESPPCIEWLPRSQESLDRTADGIETAVGLIKAQHPEASLRQVWRMFDEHLLDAMLRQMSHYQAGTPERNRLKDAYCRGLTRYRQDYEGDAGGGLYLEASAGLTLCRDWTPGAYP